MTTNYRTEMPMSIPYVHALMHSDVFVSSIGLV